MKTLILFDYVRDDAILESMEPDAHDTAFVLPPALLAEVEAAAEQEHRQASDVVREAVERYLTQWRKQVFAAQAGQTTKLTAAQAVENILEQRKANIMPDGVTIRELMTYGRA